MLHLQVVHLGFFKPESLKTGKLNVTVTELNITVETVEKFLYSYFQPRNLNKGDSVHWDSTTFWFNTLQIFGTKCTRTEKQHFLLTLLEG